MEKREQFVDMSYQDAGNYPIRQVKIIQSGT
jgi:hypothetical protein